MKQTKNKTIEVPDRAKKLLECFNDEPESINSDLVRYCKELAWAVVDLSASRTICSETKELAEAIAHYKMKQ